MINKLKLVFDFPFHPILIAIYLVFSLFAHNIAQIKASAIIRSLLFVPLIAFILLSFLRLLLKDWRRSAVLTTLYLLLFFSYGHVYHYLEVNPIMGLELGRHRILLFTYLLIAAVCTWLVITKLHNLVSVTEFCNIVSLTLMLFPLFQTVSFSISQQKAETTMVSLASTTGESRLIGSPSPPDVYYIILDGYLRPDKLKEDFNIDDSAFISALQQLGFYVATCSQANYTQTALSMASSMNMNYLDSLGVANLEGKDSSVLYPLIEENEVLKLFKQLGYTTIAFGTDYYWLNMENVDYYYRPESKALNAGESRLQLNGFESMIMRESAGLLLTDILSSLPEKIKPEFDYPDRYHRELVLYDFDQLHNIPLAVKSPKFTYAHIVAPHPPLVFGIDGEWVDLPEDLDNAGWRKAYTDEIQYVNQRTLDTVREILAVSSVPPVIIIQADHGAMISDILNYPEILNAYYLPAGGSDVLYPTVSPVNTFRIVLNQYFGGEYPLLEDKTYISSYTAPFESSPTEITCP
jgi:hypothetical protein